MANATTEFDLLRTAAACIAAVPSDRRTVILVELLRLLGVQRDALRQAIDNDSLWLAPRLLEPVPKPPPVEAEPPRREVVGTIFYDQFR
jgi:hypothetical protein